METYTLELSSEQLETLLIILDGRYDITGMEDEMDVEYFEFLTDLTYKQILHKLG